MKFLLRLATSPQGSGNILPINYQYELSAFIYHTLARSDVAYSSWLHENGFTVGKKQFRLFSFSNLIIPRFRIEGDRLLINSQEVKLIISFLPEKSTEEFIKGLFYDQQFSIGDQHSKVHFNITQIEKLAEPDFAHHTEFTTLSPVCITRHIPEENRVVYESPDTEYTSKALLINLKNKYKAFYNKEYEGDESLDFKLKSTPKSKLIVIKNNTAQQTKVKGFNFRFEIKAAPELMKMMYHGGLGEKNSMGFGAVMTVEEWRRLMS